MPETYLFLTGKLAEQSLHKVLAEMRPGGFNYRITQLGVSVAALMTPEMIMRRLPDKGDADRIMLPGLCRGDLAPLEKKYGVPVERGPEDLKDLPRFFGHGARQPDLSAFEARIFAEIVDAPQLSVDAILARAELYRAQGADVIDLGCLPGTPFPHLVEAIQALKQAGYLVSVDSVNDKDFLDGGQVGADYLLSLTEKNLWIADEVPSTPVLIPARAGSVRSLHRAIEIMRHKGRAFIADPILDPIPFGFVQSIVRYERLRKRYPDIQIMMGVGNLTELVDADTTGINALLFGIIAELGINAVLTTSVSPHAVSAIAEADIARRVMHAAKEDRRLPRDYSDALLGLHDRRPFPYSEDEIAELASRIKDPSFRIQISRSGISVYNRDGMTRGVDPFEFYSHLGVDQDASHAFYLGVELARAQIAWQLKKRYRQDEELQWGCNTYRPVRESRCSHRNAALEQKRKSIKKQ